MFKYMIDLLAHGWGECTLNTKCTPTHATTIPLEACQRSSAKAKRVKRLDILLFKVTRLCDPSLIINLHFHFSLELRSEAQLPECPSGT